jgi:Icc-related predicted phosphoesterase
MHQPKLVVFGHIHEDPGQWKIGDTTVANVTYVNRAYKPHQKPVVFDL